MTARATHRTAGNGGRSPLSVARLFALFLLAPLTVGCVSTQDIEGLQSQLADIQRQVLQIQMQAPSKGEVETLTDQVSQQRTSLLESEADMQLRLEQLSTQIERLEAKLEDTNYRLANLSQQIATTNQELKSFRSMPRFTQPISPTETGGEDGAAGGGNGVVPQQPPPQVGMDPQALYEAAYGDYVRGSYDLAVRQFRDYLRSFPDTELSDNAAYWIGECYYRQNEFRRAVREFDQVLRLYPRSDKVPSALLKKGYALLELNERTDGVDQLRRVIRTYGRSDEAELARQRLRELGVDERG